MQKCTDRKAIAWIWALGKCAVMQSFLFRLNFLLQEVLIHCRGHFCTQSCRLLLFIVSRSCKSIHLLRFLRFHATSVPFLMLHVICM